MQRGSFVVRFALIAVAGFVLVALPPVQEHLVTPFTTGLVGAATFLLQVADHPVSSHATLLYSNRFAVDVRNGCNGVEAMLILVSAILATSAGWRPKALGIAGGILLIQAVNLIRISSLYLLGLHRKDLFNLFHSGIWQVLIILLSLGIFAVWSVTIGVQRDRAAAS